MMAWAEREARRISKAIRLLQPAVPVRDGIWGDIGCGDGIFTSALYTLIRPAGVIYAVDRDPNALEALTRHFAESYPEAALHPVCADFTRELKLPALDGMIMARWVQRTRFTLWWTKRPCYPGWCGSSSPAVGWSSWNITRARAIPPYRTRWMIGTGSSLLHRPGCVRRASRPGFRRASWARCMPAQD